MPRRSANGEAVEELPTIIVDGKKRMEINGL
jgi:hypothetical protein